ncbi:MAG: C25 family cysteine peptidase [Vicinamibacterales bacterium]
MKTLLVAASRVSCLSALVLLIAVHDASASVSVGNAAKKSATAATTVTISSFDPGGASKRVLVVGLTFGQGAPTGVGVTCGGVALTLASGTSATNGNAHTEIWYLTAPTSGSADIVATWTGSHAVVMGAVSFNGADQTTPLVNGTTATGTSKSIALTITSAAGDMTLDTVSTLSVTSPYLSAPTRTQQWLDTTQASVKGGGSSADGAATVAHGWTAGSAVAWTASGVDIKAAVIGFEVGSFTKTTSAAPASQVIPHGLGQTPKAVILWTEAREDSTFSSTNAIAFRAAASAGAGSGTLTLTITKPAGTVQNDVMIAAIGVRPNTATITAPAGWTLLRKSSQGTTTANALATYYKVAGAAEGASYSWTLSTSTGSAGGIATFSGVDISDPIDVENGQVTASSVNHAAPSVTTNSSNDMVVTAHTISSAVNWTPPTGMTEATEAASQAVANNNGQSIEINYVLQAAIGATGTKTAVASAQADTGATETIALKPAYQSYFAFGFSDGTTDGSGSSASQNGVSTSAVARRMANKVLTVVKWDQTLLAEADLSTWTTTSFTLNWTTNDTLPYVIHYLLIAGSDVSAKVVRWQMPTSTGQVSVTGVGFQPTAVIHLHTGSGYTATPPANAANSGFGLGVMDFGGTQWATEMFAANAGASGDTQRAQATDAAIYTIDNGLGVTKKASFVSMDADGFTTDFTTVNNTNAGQIYSLAVLGVNVKAGSFIKTTAAAPVSQSITGTGFAPAAVFFHSFQDVPQASPVTNSRMGYGASDGVTQGSSAFADLDTADPTNFQAVDKTTKAFMKVNNSTATIDAEADLTSLDPDGFTINWTTNDAAATEVLYMGLANLLVTEVRLTSFTATKYNRGTLLQWKTGYEISNLGFNVYRDLNGVRTKLNAAPITGSGLQAGQGGVVTGEHAYARWDLDAAAGDPAAVYWLEDLDFNGKTTLHGPVAPVVSALTEPATTDSDELSDVGAAVNAKSIFFSSDLDPVQSGPRAAPQVPPAVAQQWMLASQSTVKLAIQQTGWYRVTRDDLVAAGLSAQVDPRTLQLFVNGVEQAIRVTTAASSAFASGDAIEFYGVATDTPYADTRVYWLQSGVQPGRRIALDAGGPGTGSAATGFAAALRRKDRSVYFAALRNGDTENWFGPMVSPQPAVPDPDDPWSQTALTLTLDHIDRTAAGGAQLTVALQGVTTTADGNAAHRVGVFMNGTEVGELAFLGQAHAVQTLSVPLALLLDGANRVTFEARGGDADNSLTDAITLTYPHSYQADADRLRFTVEGPGAITIGGFAGGSIRVFDITDRATPTELAVTPGSAAGLSTASVTVPGAGTRTLFAFSDETVGSPLSVTANHPSNLHQSGNVADYVIVSHADFLDAMAPLAALRRQQGHTTAVVDVADVYDEFSFGEKTPQALRDFLQWAATTWTTAPRFVVLAGDATIDPRDYAGLGNADFVPTKQTPMNGVALETATDDWFVDFRDDGLPEVAIGRLSVRDAAQASDVVAKIIGYDQVGSQAWTKDVLLVADQNSDTGNFEQASTNLSTIVPSDYRVHTDFLGALGDGPAHQALTDAVNNGQLIVNYSGHGSTQIWGGNGQLLTNGDVPAWTNASRLPLVVAMNCLNGLFNGIYGEDSLAEALQRARNGGAIAVWASSSVTPEATQSLVNQELFRLIFGGTYATVGEAVAMAKRIATNPDLRRSWIFFGDPAMRLAGAPQAATQRTLGAAPVIISQPGSAAIASGQQATLSVGASGAGPLTYQWYARTARTAMTAVAGATASTYTTNALTETTSYLVRVSNPSGTTDSALAVVSTPPVMTSATVWPAATARIGYAFTLTASNGATPYRWDATGLPSGLKMDPASGEVFDAPNAAGTFTFDVRVTGADGVSARQSFTLTVNAATDVLLDQQWHLHDRRLEVASANVVPAWAFSRGAGVVIAVVDDGVQAAHPDLQANYLAALSYDFADHDVDASADSTGVCGLSANCQGTAVAGVAAARGDNGSGGSGVAPLASLAGIRVAAGLADVDEASAFSYGLNAVQIENHSWHRADDGQTLAGPGPLAEAALATAVADGRSGAGRIFVWAAGDGRANGDNCNFDGYANTRFGIAVGAVDDTAHQAAYSESCSALLVSAPSSGVPGINRGLTTTDLGGADGYDSSDYTSAFGGTAAAAPVISGVTALMLSRNPALTWRDVQHILVRTSRQVDATDSGWTFGPFPHNEKYGFGVVDALAAVTVAATWTNVGAELAVREVTHSVGALIPDNDRAGVSDSITISNANAGVSVEHVEVEFSATHPHRGDLEVTLTSPAGVVSHLGTVRPDDAGTGFASWRFRSVRHWGESAAGTWTLTVADRAAGNVGTFTGWTLRIYGTSTSSGVGTTVGSSVPATPTPSPNAPASAPANDDQVAPPPTTTVPTSTAPAPTSADTVVPSSTRTSVVGPSLAPSSTQITVVPSNDTAAYTDPIGGVTDLSAGQHGGIYGGATEPATSAPSSERPANSASPSVEADSGNGGVPPEPTPAPEPESAPRAPADLIASVSGTTIVLKWGKPATGSMPTGYVLEAGSRAGQSNLFVSPTGSTAVSFTAKNAEAGTYFVRVRASNGLGLSEPSNEATVVVGGSDSGPCTAPPGVPGGLRFIVNGPSVILSWDAPLFGPTSYIVETASGPDGINRSVSDTHSAVTTLTEDGVTPGTYVARVRARNACGGSALSEKVTIVVH